MRQVFSRPIAHFVPLAEGVDATSLAGLPDEEFAEVWHRCKQAEEERVYRINPDLIAREIAGEWMLIPTGEFAQQFNGMISQNEFSHFVWSLFSEPRSLRDALRAAKEEYEDDTNVLDIEVRRQVEDFSRMGLIIEINKSN